MENNAEIKVSVIVPIYNAYNYLRPALDSILDQTLSELEVICIDDGSIDSSLEILKEYQERDERVRIVTETNAGPAHARNNGIRRARGEYIAFVDADDFLEPTFLEELYGVAKKSELDVAISCYDVYNSSSAKFECSGSADNADIFTPGRVTSKNEYPDQILSSTVGSAWNKLFRRKFIEEKGLTFLTDVRIYEDVYFVVTAMSLAERIGKVHKVLLHHRIHSEQSLTKMFRKCYAQVPAVFLKIKEFLIHHGMYAPLSRSYINLSAAQCYKVFNLLSPELQKKFWDLLHDEYAERLGWQEREACDFDSEDIAKFVAFVQIYTYDEYKRLLLRKSEVNIDDVGVQITKRTKKIRSFFKKLFHRKKKKD